MKLAEALLHALRDRGATEVFGIPGDFVLPFFRVMEESGILPLYTLSHEPAVGFAADVAGRANCRLGRVPWRILVQHPTPWHSRRATPVGPSQDNTQARHLSCPQPPPIPWTSKSKSPPPASPASPSPFPPKNSEENTSAACSMNGAEST